MISFEELEGRIHKQYPAVLKAFVLGKNLFPMYLRANKEPDNDFARRNRKLELLFQYSSHHHPYGYFIETVPVNRRQHGLQDEPVAFYFDTLERYLGFCGKQSEFEAFVSNVALVLKAYPGLRNWLASHCPMVIEQHGNWPNLLQVAQYFIENPRPGLFARELPLHGLGTKFVENHKGILYPLLNQLLPEEAVDQTAAGTAQFEKRFGLRTDAARVRFRWLDADKAIQYTGGLHDISTTVDELAKQNWRVHSVFIVENKTNLQRADEFLTLPNLKGSMAIFGSGRAAALLAGMGWLRGARIFYWGDVDAEGFEILDNMLSFFPAAEAFCMDLETLDKYGDKATGGSGAVVKQLSNLNHAQLQVYEHVARHNLRIEQEIISMDWVRERLGMISL